jgi:hypothetical protein
VLTGVGGLTRRRYTDSLTDALTHLLPVSRARPLRHARAPLMSGGLRHVEC